MAHTTYRPGLAPTYPWRGMLLPSAQRAGLSRAAKACIQAPLMLGVAALMYFRFHHHIMPAVITVLAVLVLAGGLFIPPLFDAFERFGRWLAKVVAATLTWSLLTPFFYLVFTFARLTLLVQGKDPMARSFPAAALSTFWVPRKPVRNLDQYRKQH